MNPSKTVTTLTHCFSVDVEGFCEGMAESFPIPALGKSIPALGGGYFRLYPLSLSKFILNSLEKRNQPAMFYVHPYEIGSR